MTDGDSYYRHFIARIDNQSLAEAISTTRDKFVEGVIDGFDWLSTQQVLLYGDVQSGKTSHVMGLIAEAADRGFPNILVLTADISLLVEQTVSRMVEYFKEFEIFGPTDEFRFRSVMKQPELSGPNLVVLNKNKAVLNRWRALLDEQGVLHGSGLLIVDDEADASSQNNKVNIEGQVTAINSVLSRIRGAATSCIYLQVTGTPQAILLQATADGWRPDFVFSFEPGNSYVGGSFFFDRIQGNSRLKITSNDRLDLDWAVLTHLVTSSIMLLEGEGVSNMVIHPSRQQDAHEEYVSRAREAVARFAEAGSDEEFERRVFMVYKDLSDADCELPEFGSVKARLLLMLQNDEVSFYIVNSAIQPQPIHGNLE